MAYKRSDYLDVMGRYKTLSLFLESAYDKDALYTLAEYDKEYEGKVYPSIKLLYLAEEDVTEYEFANKHLAGWKQWQKLLRNSVIREHIEDWRAELELKMTARNMRRIEDMAAAGSYNAARFIANKEYANGKGRPSKAEKQAALASSKVEASEHQEDAARVLQFIKKEK